MQCRTACFTSDIAVGDLVQLAAVSSRYSDADDFAEESVQVRGKVVRVEGRAAVADSPVQVVLVVLRDNLSSRQRKRERGMERGREK